MKSINIPCCLKKEIFVHPQVVTFLVNFGVNVYALDIDMHTAQELAAINNADHILRYLDAAIAKVSIKINQSRSIRNTQGYIY